MSPAPRTRAPHLASALLALLLPAASMAQEPVLPGPAARDHASVRAWKAGYAKRMNEERYEHQEEREKREERLRELAKQLSRSGNSSLSTRGQRAKPAKPEDLLAPILDGSANARLWRGIGRYAIT